MQLYNNYTLVPSPQQKLKRMTHKNDFCYILSLLYIIVVALALSPAMLGVEFKSTEAKVTSRTTYGRSYHGGTGSLPTVAVTLQEFLKYDLTFLYYLPIITVMTIEHQLFPQ